MSDKVEVRAVSAPWHGGVELLVRQGDAFGTNITMETKAGGAPVGPTLTIKMDEAQTLMDDLWASGIRPTEGTGSAGSLRATEKHLADMRRLVFDSNGNGGSHADRRLYILSSTAREAFEYAQLKGYSPADTVAVTDSTKLLGLRGLTLHVLNTSYDMADYSKILCEAESRGFKIVKV